MVDGEVVALASVGSMILVFLLARQCFVRGIATTGWQWRLSLVALPGIG